MNKSPLTIAIFGSCVSRDTFTVLEQDGAVLSSYTARQSLISAYALKPSFVENIDDTKLSSVFQQKMVLGDLRGTFRHELLQIANEVDVFLVDLVDERGGVLVDDNGGCITNSLELKKSEIVPEDLELRSIKFGSDEHFQLWTEAFNSFVADIRKLGLDERLIVLCAPWALESAEGDRFPLPGSSLQPERMNKLYERYYAHVAEIVPEAIRTVPESLCVAVRDHRWGLAPFHYDRPFYTYIRESLMGRSA